jgi:hypothetical protein
LEFLSSATGLSDLDLKRSGKFRGFRDVRFSHPRHATNDHSDAVAAPEGMSAPENDRHAEDNGTPSFSAFFKLTAPSVSCADLAAKFPRPSSAALASALRVTSVLNFFGVPAKGQRCSDNDDDSDDVPSAASVVQGSIELVISDFEDGSSDRFGEITTADGAIVAVGGPDSNDAADQSAWSSIRSGDRVEMEIDADEVGPHRVDEMILATSDIEASMGQAYRHAKRRHRMRSVKRHEPVKSLLETVSEGDDDKSAGDDKAVPKGAIKLIAIRVQYTDWNPDSVCTTSCLQNNLWTGATNVDQQYRDSSYGQVTLPQAYGKILTVSLPVSSKSYSNCNNLGAIAAAADAAVAAQYPAVILSGYHVRLYVTGAICGIGVAYLGGTPGKAFVNSAYPDTIAHEIGHNFGMQHSNRDPGDDNYVDESYGDRSCVMGYSHVGLRGFNVVHRIENGWIPSTAVRYLSTGCMTAPVTYTLSPLSKARLTNAVVAVRAVRRNFGAYFIAFRNSDGYDANQASTYVNRVHIEYQITKGGYTQMVKALAAGETWTQPNGDMTVTVVSISSTAAVVSIKYCRPSTFNGLAGVLTCGSTISATNVGAANLAGYGSGDKVYMMALNSAYKYTFSTCGSSLNTVLRVYSDGMYEQKSMCDNCGSCSSNQYNAVISGFTGSGYHFISVEGFNTASGTFVLSVTCTPNSAKEATAPLLDASQIPRVAESTIDSSISETQA